MWSLLVSYTHVFPAAVLRAARESGTAVLVSCAGHLVRLALDTKCTKVWRRRLENKGLEALTLEVAREVMVSVTARSTTYNNPGMWEECGVVDVMDL